MKKRPCIYLLIYFKKYKLNSEWIFETRETVNGINYEGLVHEERPGGFDWDNRE